MSYDLPAAVDPVWVSNPGSGNGVTNRSEDARRVHEAFETPSGSPTKPYDLAAVIDSPGAGITKKGVGVINRGEDARRVHEAMVIGGVVEPSDDLAAVIDSSGLSIGGSRDIKRSEDASSVHEARLPVPSR